MFFLESSFKLWHHIIIRKPLQSNSLQIHKRSMTQHRTQEPPENVTSLCVACTLHTLFLLDCSYLHHIYQPEQPFLLMWKENTASHKTWRFFYVSQNSDTPVIYFITPFNFSLVDSVIMVLNITHKAIQELKGTLPVQSWGWCWSWSWLRRRSECLGTTPWTGSLEVVPWPQMPPAVPWEPGSHDVAPRHQNVPGPVGKPGLGPLKAERTMGGK